MDADGLRVESPCLRLLQEPCPAELSRVGAMRRRFTRRCQPRLVSHPFARRGLSPHLGRETRSQTSESGCASRRRSPLRLSPQVDSAICSSGNFGRRSAYSSPFAS